MLLCIICSYLFVHLYYFLYHFYRSTHYFNRPASDDLLALPILKGNSLSNCLISRGVELSECQMSVIRLMYNGRRKKLKQNNISNSKFKCLHTVENKIPKAATTNGQIYFY